MSITIRNAGISMFFSDFCISFSYFLVCRLLLYWLLFLWLDWFLFNLLNRLFILLRFFTSNFFIVCFLFIIVFRFFLITFFLFIIHFIIFIKCLIFCFIL